MSNKITLLSGKTPTKNSANVLSSRYQFLELGSAEPNLGTANVGDILSYDTAYPGSRKWISQIDIPLKGGTLNGDLIITGNLSVLGNSTTLSTNQLDIKDSLIYLANNNFTSDIIDIGIIGHYANAASGNSATGGGGVWTGACNYVFDK